MPQVRALLAISRDAVLVVRHADHRIVGASASAARIYGSSETTLCQLSYDDLVTDRRAVGDIFGQHREHVPLRYHRRADGSRFPVEIAIHWLDEADGSELGYFRVRDLSRAEAEERRLRAAEHSHQAIFQAAPFPILLLDRRGMVSDANDAALALYHHTAATLIGQPMAALLQDERVSRRYFRTSHWQDTGQWHLRSNGVPFLAEVNVSIVRLSADAHAIVVVQDVTAMRTLLERLQTSEARWRFALEGHGDALWEWDLLRSSIHVSRELSAQLGQGARPQEHAPAHWSSQVHADDRPRLYREMTAHLKGETALIDIEVRMNMHAGPDRWVWLRGRVMERDGAGRALRLLGSVRDVHAQKQQAEELAHWREQVQHTARLTSMGEMAAALAHELNQPLTSIRNFSAAALRRLDSEPLRDPVELRRITQLIADETLRAGRIMQHIRGVVRKGAARPQAVAINDLVANVGRLADVQARHVGASIDLALAHELPDVWADPVLAEQLLLNLVRNGLEAMTDSRAERRIEISTGLDGAGMVAVCVRDRGIGLPPGLQSNLYAPFVTTKPEGLGMGLAICRSIVESHHGQLWAEPNPGGGAAFHFTLPMPPAPQ